MHPLAALGTGLAAGLAIAAPLGAIAVLLVARGLTDGFTKTAPAALGVAAVDLTYATVAVLVGSRIAPLLVSLAPWPACAGGVLLIVIAALGLRSRPDEERTVAQRSPGRLFFVFFGLTAVNPATVIYFASIVTGLHSLLASTASAVAFVLGVAVASAAWQLGLVAAAAAFHTKASDRARRATVLLGNALVATMGVIVLFRALG